MREYYIVDDDGALDGVGGNPGAVLENLEAADAVLEDEGDAVAVLVLADAVVLVRHRREVAQQRHEVEAAVAVVLLEEARLEAHALVQDLDQHSQLGQLDVALL
uniref:Uncharacterized protein n=1 Tax=Leersia perrieri TaxID=77586 RepID=A0A0D9WA87_9ORYZ